MKMKLSDKKLMQKNSLENYAYTLRNSLKEEAVAAKIDSSDKNTLESKVDETVKWLEANQNESKDIYEKKQKELESVAMPIMTKLYQQGAGTGQPGAGFPGSGAGTSTGATPNHEHSTSGRSGPTVEEVD